MAFGIRKESRHMAPHGSSFKLAACCPSLKNGGIPIRLRYLLLGMVYVFF
jgi:hypothetical protein